MGALVDAYLIWKAGGPENGEEEMAMDLHEFEVTAIDTFSKSSFLMLFFLPYPQPST